MYHVSLGVSEVLKFANFFHLNLRETVPVRFLSSNRDNLRGVIRELRVDRMLGLTGQEIDFSVLALDSYRQSFPNAFARVRGVLRSAHVVGNVTSHIEQLALDGDFRRLRDPLISPIPKFQRNECYCGGNDDRCCELKNSAPIAPKWNRLVADNPFRKTKRRLDFAKLRSDILETSYVFAQPVGQFSIAAGKVQRFFKLRIGIVDGAAIEEQFFPGFAR